MEENVNPPKFKVEERVIYAGGLFPIKKVSSWNGPYAYKIGDGSLGFIDEPLLRKADWRDELRITGKTNIKV